ANFDFCIAFTPLEWKYRGYVELLRVYRPRHSAALNQLGGDERMEKMRWTFACRGLGGEKGENECM
ncbi:MAG: hypothetical protein J7J46_04185, partial [Candidatus Desulfofervidus sp.]|nr:hypothetical protein [Candidatus Desulfofervidus sp.]